MDDYATHAKRILNGRKLDDVTVGELKKLIIGGSQMAMIGDDHDDHLMVVVSQHQGTEYVQRQLINPAHLESARQALHEDGGIHGQPPEPSNLDLFEMMRHILQGKREEREAMERERANNPHPPKSKHFPEGPGVTTTPGVLDELYSSTVGELREALGKGDAVTVCTREMEDGHPYAMVQASGNAAFAILSILENHGVIKVASKDGFDFNTLVRGAEA